MFRRIWNQAEKGKARETLEEETSNQVPHAATGKGVKEPCHITDDFDNIKKRKIVKIIIFRGVISWAEVVGVEVGKGRVEVVGEEQVEEEEEVMEMVELRSNARHSSNPPALPGDNQILFCQHEYTLVGMWRKNRANLWQTHPAKNFQKSFVEKVNWKNVLFEFTSCMENVHIWGK